MSKDTLHTALRFVLIGVITASLLLLGWWYFFLKRETASQQAIDTARGLETNIPELTSSEGSTYLNLVRSIPSVPLWRNVRDAAKEIAQPFLLLGERENETDRQRLWHVSALPTSGMSFLFAGGTTTIRFVERATGNVLEANVDTHAVSRRTNTLIPEVEEALFAGTRVFLRNAENGILSTKTGIVEMSEGVRPFILDEFQEHLLSFAVSPSGREVSYLRPEENGNVSLVSASANGENKKHVATLGTRDWNIYYAGENRIVVTGRPADNVPGYAYEVSSKEALLPILRNMPGLAVTVHASSTAILFSTSDKEELSLFVQKNKMDSPLLLPLSTVAEKCVFAPSGVTAYCAVPRGNTGDRFLDRWYRGEVHTSDVLWEVDVEKGVVRQMFDPELEAGVSIDVEMPVVNKDNTHLAFRDSQDWSLWLLKLR